MKHTIALFGASERGHFARPELVRDVNELYMHLGQPPSDSKGLFFAIQALMYERNCLFFRVQEEGFSAREYLAGLKYLETVNIQTPISAICLPGVGDSRLIELGSGVCQKRGSILITTQADLYDILTHQELAI